MENGDVRFNKLVKILVILGDMVICGLLFYLFTWWEETKRGQNYLEASFGQVIIVLLLVYMISAVSGKVVLHRRKVFDYQIVIQVLRNVFYFSVFSMLLLAVGNFMHVFNMFYVAFVSASFLCITLYRLTCRWFIKYYRTRRRNLNRVVLVGSTTNNIELYHELSDDPTMGYHVDGYFDWKENEAFTELCPYLT